MIQIHIKNREVLQNMTDETCSQCGSKKEKMSNGQLGCYDCYWKFHNGDW